MIAPLATLAFALAAYAAAWALFRTALRHGPQIRAALRGRPTLPIRLRPKR